jgi:RyR domain
MPYTDEQIARVVHETIRGMQYVQGDPAPSPPWDSMPADQRQAALSGIEAARRGLSPAQLHESWAARLRAQGWSYGERKDPQARTHPCLCAYEQLPQHQRDKDVVYSAVVLALTGGPGGA